MSASAGPWSSVGGTIAETIIASIKNLVPWGAEREEWMK